MDLPTEKQNAHIKVLFVCMGNICRSPMAEAIFRHQVADAGLADRFEIDSAGTHSYHVGERPHPGTQRVLYTHGIDVGDQRARQLRPGDFRTFDYIVAMDADNVADMTDYAPRADMVYRLLDFSPNQSLRDVPDPYYTGQFEEVYELVANAAKGLLVYIRRERGL